MSEESDNLVKQLQQFNLSENEVRLYLFLLQKGPKSALTISRELKIPRTKIYRLSEKLLDKALVVEEIRDGGKKFIAEDPEKFMRIIHEREQDLLLLKSSAPTILNQLKSMQAFLGSETKILYYKGFEGLKQVTWNSTKNRGVFRIYEMAQSMEGFMGKNFAEKVRIEYSKNSQAEFRQLTNFKEILDSTKIIKHIDQWTPKYISPEKLKISVEIQIYNDVYCMYEYANEDVFIVEIYNQELADMQKQIFDLVWDGALPMEKLNRNGWAQLITN